MSTVHTNAPSAEDIRASITTLAGFVARNKQSFEDAVKQRHKGNPLFRFLFEPDSEDFKFYRKCVEEQRAANSTSTASPGGVANSETATNSEHVVNSESAPNSEHVVNSESSPNSEIVVNSEGVANSADAVNSGNEASSGSATGSAHMVNSVDTPSSENSSCSGNTGNSRSVEHTVAAESEEPENIRTPACSQSASSSIDVRRGSQSELCAVQGNHDEAAASEVKTEYVVRDGTSTREVKKEATSSGGQTPDSSCISQGAAMTSAAGRAPKDELKHEGGDGGGDAVGTSLSEISDMFASVDAAHAATGSAAPGVGRSATLTGDGRSRSESDEAPASEAADSSVLTSSNGTTERSNSTLATVTPCTRDTRKVASVAACDMPMLESVPADSEDPTRACALAGSSTGEAETQPRESDAPPITVEAQQDSETQSSESSSSPSPSIAIGSIGISARCGARILEKESLSLSPVNVVIRSFPLPLGRWILVYCDKSKSLSAGVDSKDDSDHDDNDSDSDSAEEGEVVPPKKPAAEDFAPFLMKIGKVDQLAGRSELLAWLAQNSQVRSELSSLNAYCNADKQDAGNTSLYLNFIESISLKVIHNSSSPTLDSVDEKGAAVDGLNFPRGDGYQAFGFPEGSTVGDFSCAPSNANGDIRQFDLWWQDGYVSSPLPRSPTNDSPGGSIVVPMSDEDTEVVVVKAEIEPYVPEATLAFESAYAPAETGATEGGENAANVLEDAASDDNVESAYAPADSAAAEGGEGAANVSEDATMGGESNHLGDNVEREASPVPSEDEGDDEDEDDSAVFASAGGIGGYYTPRPHDPVPVAMFRHNAEAAEQSARERAERERARRAAEAAEARRIQEAADAEARRIQEAADAEARRARDLADAHARAHAQDRARLHYRHHHRGRGGGGRPHHFYEPQNPRSRTPDAHAHAHAHAHGSHGHQHHPPPHHPNHTEYDPSFPEYDQSAAPSQALPFESQFYEEPLRGGEDEEEVVYGSASRQRQQSRRRGHESYDELLQTHEVLAPGEGEDEPRRSRSSWKPVRPATPLHPSSTRDDEDDYTYDSSERESRVAKRRKTNLAAAGGAPSSAERDRDKGAHSKSTRPSSSRELSRSDTLEKSSDTSRKGKSAASARVPTISLIDSPILSRQKSTSASESKLEEKSAAPRPPPSSDSSRSSASSSSSSSSKSAAAANDEEKSPPLSPLEEMTKLYESLSVPQRYDLFGVFLNKGFAAPKTANAAAAAGRSGGRKKRKKTTVFVGDSDDEEDDDEEEEADGSAKARKGGGSFDEVCQLVPLGSKAKPLCSRCRTVIDAERERRKKASEPSSVRESGMRMRPGPSNQPAQSSRDMEKAQRRLLANPPAPTAGASGGGGLLGTKRVRPAAGSGLGARTGLGGSSGLQSASAHYKRLAAARLANGSNKKRKLSTFDELLKENDTEAKAEEAEYDFAASSSSPISKAVPKSVPSKRTLSQLSSAPSSAKPQPHSTGGSASSSSANSRSSTHIALNKSMKRPLTPVAGLSKAVASSPSSVPKKSAKSAHDGESGSESESSSDDCSLDAVAGEIEREMRERKRVRVASATSAQYPVAVRKALNLFFERKHIPSREPTRANLCRVLALLPNPPTPLPRSDSVARLCALVESRAADVQAFLRKTQAANGGGRTPSAAAARVNGRTPTAAGAAARINGRTPTVPASGRKPNVPQSSAARRPASAAAAGHRRSVPVVPKFNADAVMRYRAAARESPAAGRSSGGGRNTAAARPGISKPSAAAPKPPINRAAAHRQVMALFNSNKKQKKRKFKFLK